MEKIMLKIKHVIALLAFAAASSAMLASSAHAAGPTGTAADYGTSVAASTDARQITISPQTKWVNVTDGETVVIPGVMEHVERAGVHSGDSYAVYPAPGLERSEVDDVVDYTVRIARHLRLRGLVNVQYVVHRGKVHVLEVNPRASRTVPFISKVTGIPMVDMATKVMLGQKLSDMGWKTGLVPPRDLDRLAETLNRLLRDGVKD